MPDTPAPLDALRRDIVAASRILSAEGVLDAFGHVSARHPARPDRYLISRARAPELATIEDVVELGLDGEPTAPLTVRLFAERVIHGAIYRARPDVHAVCHHHAAAMLPFCISGAPLVPVYHLGATMGAVVPTWDSQDDFGDTNLLVMTADQGASLARALGPHWTVLMRRHGVTVAGRSLPELAFRAIYGARNAELQQRALALGGAPALPPGEAELAGEFNLRPIAVERAWELWNARLARA
jgi:HCOMODA/2-hydroxy-3-carboxy-muconic semialdehyde decarboxylase